MWLCFEDRFLTHSFFWINIFGFVTSQIFPISKLQQIALLFNEKFLWADWEIWWVTHRGFDLFGNSIPLNRSLKMHLSLALSLYWLNELRVQSHFLTKLLQTEVITELFLKNERIIFVHKHSILESNLLQGLQNYSVIAERLKLRQTPVYVFPSAFQIITDLNESPSVSKFRTHLTRIGHRFVPLSLIRDNICKFLRESNLPLLALVWNLAKLRYTSWSLTGEGRESLSVCQLCQSRRCQANFWQYN